MFEPDTNSQDKDKLNCFYNAKPMLSLLLTMCVIVREAPYGHVAQWIWSSKEWVQCRETWNCILTMKSIHLKYSGLREPCALFAS